MSRQFTIIWDSERANVSIRRVSAVQQDQQDLISFIARITASRRLLPVKFDSYALSELSSALESNDIESLATDVPAAAQWIFHTGHLVYHLNHEYEPHGASGGPLWGGKRGFCVDRWNLWKSQFAWVSTLWQLHKSTRELAAMARDAIINGGV